MYPNHRYQSPSYSRQNAAQHPATKTPTVAIKRSQTRWAPIGIEPDYDVTELTQTVLQNANGKRYTMVSNGWSKECTITALIQFEDCPSPSDDAEGDDHQPSVCPACNLTAPHVQEYHGAARYQHQC
jgi:hypothetical protein